MSLVGQSGTFPGKERIQGVKVQALLGQGFYQLQLLGVLGDDLGNILRYDAVKLGSGLGLGTQVGNPAAVEDPLGYGTDRHDAGNDQTGDAGAVLRHLVEIGQGHQQFVAAAGDDQQRRRLEQLGYALGGGGTDLHVVDDAPHFAPVALPGG